MPQPSAVGAGVLRMRRLPTAARYVLAIGIALLCSGFEVLSGGRLPDVAAYLLAFLGVLLCSALFDRGSGFLATAVSALVLTAFRSGAGVSLSLSGADLLVLGLFVAVSAVAALIVEALHRAVERAEEAREALEAAAVKRRLLLDEYRHRTRNDLASLAAMLLLRARAVASGRAAEGLREAAEHARTLARVHTLLAQETGWPDDDPGVVDTRVFVEGLCREIDATAVGGGCGR
ncbi:DUF4118 domain-containing protein (plasmid) [Roseomonas sp. CCTCC AB2023176]|uniref:DUF4118 domain-containing protein n=1 Tax=Roseomonas sp. CCTCC AB2023176 TaxID=3342640 RepID=UPI0035D5A504